MYDYVFVTHLPSFYKVNLYNALSEHLNVFVIFIGEQSSERTSDFTASQQKFKSYTLCRGDFENRSIWSTGFEFVRILRSLQFKKLVLGGWELPEFWLGLLLVPKAQAALALESTIHESATTGIRAWVKQFFLKRISTVFATSSASQHLLRALNYTGVVQLTQGVGILEKKSHLKREKNGYFGRYIYLGRLSSEKNLALLLRVFETLPDLKLTIVGSGPLEDHLKIHKPSNVTMIPHIANSEIQRELIRHDFLILASQRDTWGLVVEEALYCGLPVVVASNCGAADLVTAGKNGLICEDNTDFGWIKLLKSIHQDQYLVIEKSIDSHQIDQKDQSQIQCYLTEFQS